MFLLSVITLYERRKHKENATKERKIKYCLCRLWWWIISHIKQNGKPYLKSQGHVKEKEKKRPTVAANLMLINCLLSCWDNSRQSWFFALANPLWPCIKVIYNYLLLAYSPVNCSGSPQRSNFAHKLNTIQNMHIT